MNEINNYSDRTIIIGGKCYRLQQYIDKTATDIHHLIWKKYRHKYHTNAECNKVKINRRKHIALNAFFGDKQSPREQLIEIFNLVKPVLSEWVKHELEVILTMTDDDLFYNEEVLHNGRNKKKRTKGWEECLQSMNSDEGEL